jgi:hypothetical protein
MLCIDCWRLKGVKPKKSREKEDDENEQESS